MADWGYIASDLGVAGDGAAAGERSAGDPLIDLMLCTRRCTGRRCDEWGEGVRSFFADSARRRHASARSAAHRRPLEANRGVNGQRLARWRIRVVSSLT